MHYTFQGKIIKVGGVVPCTGKVKEKCTFIVRDDNDDGREVAFIVFDKNIDSFLGPLSIGDKIEVTFTIKSREYIRNGVNTGDYSTSCFAIGVKKLEEEKKQRTGRDRYNSGSQNGNENPYSNSRQSSSTYNFWQEWQEKYKQKGEFHTEPPPWESQTKSTYTDYFAGCKNAQDAKKKYRELCRLHHPDKGGDAEKMKEVNQQYESWK